MGAPSPSPPCVILGRLVSRPSVLKGALPQPLGAQARASLPPPCKANLELPFPDPSLPLYYVLGHPLVCSLARFWTTPRSHLGRGRGVRRARTRTPRARRPGERPPRCAAAPAPWDISIMRWGNRSLPCKANTGPHAHFLACFPLWVLSFWPPQVVLGWCS